MISFIVLVVCSCDEKRSHDSEASDADHGESFNGELLQKQYMPFIDSTDVSRMVKKIFFPPNLAVCLLFFCLWQFAAYYPVRFVVLVIILFQSNVLDAFVYETRIP